MLIEGRQMARRSPSSGGKTKAILEPMHLARGTLMRGCQTWREREWQETTIGTRELVHVPRWQRLRVDLSASNKI